MKGLSTHFKDKLRAFLIKDYELNGNKDNDGFFKRLLKDIVGLIKILIIVEICFAIFLFCLSFRINFSESVPRGLYLALLPNHKSDMIGFCLRSDIATYAMNRGYIDKGDCPDGSRRLLKRIVGHEGDFVEITDDGIFINGKFLGDHTKPLLQDSHGRPMPQFRYVGEIPDGHVVVIGDTAKSFDSRYYGTIALRRNDVYVKPVLTF